MMRKIGFAGILVLLLLCLVVSGWVTVGPGEVVVVRRFGRILSQLWEPGAHWSWPLGIDRLNRIRRDEVRRLEFGRIAPAGPLDAPGSGEYLTGDLNLIRAQGVIQYRVSDPSAFVLRANDLDGILTRCSEASLARALTSRTIEAPLRAGRAELASQVGETLQQSVDALGLGIAILGVNLTDARPPIEVEPAFADAQSAQSAFEQRINEARALAGQLLPAAQASAETATDDAQAKADRKAAMARAEADRFAQLLVEADKSRTLTVLTLYRDSLRDLLPKVRRKVLMTPDEPVDLGLIGR